MMFHVTANDFHVYNTKTTQVFICTIDTLRSCGLELVPAVPALTAAETTVLIVVRVCQ